MQYILQIDSDQSRLAKRMLLGAAFCVIFTAGAFVSYRMGWGWEFQGVPFATLVTAIGICFGYTVYQALKLREDASLLKASDKGLDIRNLSGHRLHVPWADIDRMEYLADEAHQVLLVLVKDPLENISQRENVLHEGLLSLNRKYGTPYCVRITESDCNDMDDLLGELRELRVEFGHATAS